MTGQEKERKENLRSALEQANRWYRHIDIYLWAISSALLAVTGFAFKFAIVMDGKDWKVVLIGLVMMLIWHQFRQFLMDVLLKVQYFLTRINELEEELVIDVIPNYQNDNQKPLAPKVFGDYIIRSSKNVKSKSFPEVMIFFSHLACAAWLIFIYEYLIRFFKN